jgi:Predicted carboxypeptidase
MKKLVGICSFLICFLSSFSQLKSPEEFLGYKIGTHFTPHWKLMEYFRSVAASVPSMVKIEQYGQTNEGRPLIVAYISTPEHISNLESIRSNNLRLAGLGDNAAGTTNTPVIVWLSYNVHGNEPSSSEASMLTLYALVDPSNTQTKKWLQNTLVIIDPCINPDGRDRYVNWYNSIVGKTFNPSVDAREHREPWPQGRTNHYNFDLNRDWAWQTQIETRQRLALYNRWLPQVHVDYHEQGYNNPYYFAPAAQPYHEVITSWQREFQNIIGRNHAKYFDKNGWLYFTKEVFDLLYPSYGDTYPIYNGAIGMTYEQGGIGAGLGILNNYNDTLTLTDRAMHHFTTSLSTLEVSSENAARLVSEFQKFYHNAVTSGVGNYKSYIIKYNQNDAEKIQSLLELLNKNRIQYGSAKGGTIRGFNYDSGKEETVSTNSSDIIIPSLQPKSALVKVLFEPKAVLVDSATYDITAWALPYVYGVKAYASVQKADFTSYDAPKFSSANLNNESNYGYVIRWSGLQSVRLVAQLLQKGIKLRYNEQPFEINGQVFERGAVIVLKTSNQYVPDLWSTVINLANANNVTITPVSSGFVDKGYDFGSSRIRPVKARRVAVVTGEGVNSNAAGEVWYFFDQLINYPATLINASDLSRINWNNYDVIIFPDGNYRYLNDKTTSEQFRSWINNGGNAIAIEGAVSQLAKLDFGLKSKKADDTSNSKNIYESLHTYETRQRDEITNTTPGSIYKVELDNTHPLAFGYPGYYFTLKQDDNIYEFLKDGGWNVGVIKKEKQVSGFVGSKLQNRLQDGLLFGVQDIGRGTITYLADDVLFRSFWENGKLLFANAVFLVGE